MANIQHIATRIFRHVYTGHLAIHANITPVRFWDGW